MPMLIYNLLFPLLFVLYLPFYLARLAKRGGLNKHFWERFGLYTPEQKKNLRRLSDPVWIHAVSVGEVVAATGFIARWKEREPGIEFVLSTTTTTGHALALKKLSGDVPLIYCPIDFWLIVWRVLRLVSPRALVIFEVEYWPNLISQVHGRGAPVVLVNGRMSDKSSAGYARHKWFFGKLFNKFSLFCMQSEADVERVQRVVGTEAPVYACNTMKFDQVPDAVGEDKTDLFDRVFGRKERLIWVAGSTHADEEALLADVFKALAAEVPTLKLVLVPRHHERTAEVEKVLQNRGLQYRLLTEVCGNAGVTMAGGEQRAPGNGKPPAGEHGAQVLLVNTTGELMGFYGVSDVVYVGKSLAGCTGGHNIIEPAIFGKPIIHGANMQNFRLVAQLFRDARATVEVSEDDQLLPAVRQLCQSEEMRRSLAEKSRAVVDQCRGAMDRTLDLIARLKPI